MSLRADDPHDQDAAARLHPADWTPPTPAGRYDLVVIGGGPAGLVGALGAAGLGARVALVERGFLGGDCLVDGCVPSKALLASARAAQAAREVGRFGVRAGPVEVDFAAVMSRMRRLRADIAHHDAATRLRDAGVDVFFGAGRFTGPDAVDVEGTALRFARALLATGARPLVPDLPGLDDVAPLTSGSLFALTTLPQRLVVLGAGPVGVEMAQAFRRFGSEVTLVEQADRVLPREDPDASALLARRLSDDGVRIVLGERVVGFTRDGGDRIVRLASGARVAGDAVLLALGRRANVHGLGLDAAGIRHGERVVVDRYLRTTNRRVYAAGDVCSADRFTHTADAQARIVLRNALFLGRERADRLVAPRAAYTDPEVAAVGAPRGPHTFTIPLGDTDRGRVDGLEGFVRVHADAAGRILGATAVGPHAGDLVNTVALAMTAGMRLSAFASTVFAYPTASEALRKIGDAWQRTRLTPPAASILRAWLRWRPW